MQGRYKMANDFSWTCPYCRQVATIKDDNLSTELHVFNNNNKFGYIGIKSNVVVCPNSKCKEFVIRAGLYKLSFEGHAHTIGEPLLSWRLKPQSAAKPFPSYIPEVILQDYNEACLISGLSPKASATLSRRCLQGIIRDFWDISKARLIDEINELQGRIDATTWAAIDAVRGIGNIGAHMEKDINIIVDVEPEEADMLLGLIEVLLHEWYIRRHERESHMQKIIATAHEKVAAKKGLTVAVEAPESATP
jgi:hypothetical protein